MRIRTAKTERACSRGHRGGFTLLEMLIALAVMGVGVTVFIQLYSSSLTLARTSVNHRIAVEVANEQLALMQQRPEQYLWNISVPGADERFPVTLGPDDPKAGNPAEGPAALPAEERARNRDAVRYAQFRWKAFGELRHNASYYDLTVVVRWMEEGREKMLAMTSAVARDKVDTVRRKQAPPEESEAEAADDSGDAEADAGDEEAVE